MALAMLAGATTRLMAAVVKSSEPEPLALLALLGSLCSSLGSVWISDGKHNVHLSSYRLLMFYRSFFRMQPGSKKYLTQWIHDIWRNKFLFCAVMAGIVTLFPVLYIPKLNTIVFKHTGISWVSCLGFLLLMQRTDLEVGMGYCVHSRTAILLRVRDIQTHQASILQKASKEDWVW